MNAMQPARSAGIERLAGLGAIAYVVLFIVGNAIGFNGAPTGDEAPAKYIAFYSDSGNRDQIAIGWLIVLFGVFFFLFFLAALRQVVAAVDARGFLTTLTTIGGAVYASLTLVGLSFWTAVATMSDDTFRHTVYPGVVHAASDAGWVIHSGGGVGAAAMIIGASLAASGAGLIPRWGGTVGIVFGILAIFSVFFFPQLAIALWLLVAGWLVFRLDRRSTAAA
jgi:hypothetical protein